MQHGNGDSPVDDKVGDFGCPRPPAMPFEQRSVTYSIVVQASRNILFAMGGQVAMTDAR